MSTNSEHHRGNLGKETADWYSSQGRQGSRNPCEVNYQVIGALETGGTIIDD